MNKGKQNGITLIALIITIIVMLILVSVTVRTAINSGLFGHAKDAIESWKRVELEEELGAIETSLQIKKLTQGTVTPEDYFEELKNEGMITDSEVGGDNIREIEPDENGNPTYEITLEDGSVIEVVITPDGNITTEYQGQDKNLPPKIREIEVKNKNTNSISVEVKVNRLDKGTLSYYYQEQGTTNMQTLKEDTEDLTAEFTGLKQNVIYNIKVVVENKKGSNEKSINVLTGTLPTGIIRQKGETRWENEAATIELETTAELQQGTEIQYQVNEGEWKKYSQSISDLRHGDIIFVRLYDGVNESIEESTFVILDNEKPNDAVITLGGNNTTTISTIKATVTLSDNKSGIDFEKCKWVYNDNPSKIGEEESDISRYTGGNISSNGQEIELAKMEKGQYYLHILSIDKAGNRKETVSGAITVVQLAEGVTLNQTTATINMGNTLQLTATVAPDSTNNKGVTWTSNNTNIATVNASGLVTPKAVGTVAITVKTNDGSNKTATCNVTVRQLSTGITLNQTTATVNMGSTLQLTATVAPNTTSNKGVTWTSSNTNVATVNGSGLVTPKAVGTATITVKTADGTNKTATCNVTVRQLATGVTLNKTAATINMGSTLQLTATVAPNTTSNKGVTWTSSNTNVATVNGSGLVTPKAVGTATITVKTNDGSNKTATCNVTVRQLVTGITLNRTTAQMVSRNTLQLTTNITPSTASNKAVTWKSSNTAVATVNASGLVTAITEGTCTITATSQDGSAKNASCTINVTNWSTTSNNSVAQSTIVKPASTSSPTVLKINDSATKNVNTGIRYNQPIKKGDVISVTYLYTRSNNSYYLDLRVNNVATNGTYGPSSGLYPGNANKTLTFNTTATSDANSFDITVFRSDNPSAGYYVTVNIYEVKLNGKKIL